MTQETFKDSSYRGLAFFSTTFFFFNQTLSYFLFPLTYMICVENTIGLPPNSHSLLLSLLLDPMFLGAGLPFLEGWAIPQLEVVNHQWSKSLCIYTKWLWCNLSDKAWREVCWVFLRDTRQSSSYFFSWMMPPVYETCGVVIVGSLGEPAYKNSM